MYRYDDYDRQLVRERVSQFRDQTRRYLAGQLSEDEFRPLRLQNGLYIQRHAPMLRIAVPYGILSSAQLRGLAQVARRYDKGVGHFTTRHNMQFNWPKLEDVPAILADLAEVDMHAIQTSGNCIRNVTTDPLAGVARREVDDPRPWCEILRQWSTFHPEFAYLPRKFKIAVSGGPDDHANVRIHDLGFQLVKRGEELGFRVWVGGGLGRTPILGQVICGFLPWQHLLTYSEAILRVYNRFGRRDNPFKARIKILVKALGVEEFAHQVNEEWQHLKDGPSTLTEAEVARVSASFQRPPYEVLGNVDALFEITKRNDPGFAQWATHNVHAHQVPGYAAATLSLKKPGERPGDISSEQMEQVADLCERFGFGEVRVSQAQNLLLPDVRQSDLYTLWQTIAASGLATPTIGLISDVTTCPGGDLCSLANARSTPVANAIQQRFASLAEQENIGELKLNVSGCMNACGHHHVGHIGILGVDKAGKEFYQVTLGGAWGIEAALGKVVGPSFSAEEVPVAVERIVTHYKAVRRPGERFIDTFRRLGMEEFKPYAYAKEAEQTDTREVVNG
ncbi:nitrite/sulfite reductase [Denitratisoma oestradiolicum]|uniref:Sulfite reductase n=1 Tax=Denitratisoma oestradiolicum TaxID=311182 RepID=A0A6S6XUN6_9PROT|nr:nitrite/sulfite reductase [Denitratisoma oestradiolicum]TWO81161.1 sulfite reductase [Denitratisoma oestradiolicum]CAB1367853.1 Sulfite reductase [Denitratisoma oestradiolicum]